MNSLFPPPPDDRPTLYLTHAAVTRAGFVGTGRRWTIMAEPRSFEACEGLIVPLAPLGDLLRPLMRAARAERKAGLGETLAMDAYKAAYDLRMGIFADILTPGRLRTSKGFVVRGGDTLCCGGECSIEEGRAGRCHRAWASVALVRAGWRVVCDGVEVRDGR